MSFSILKHALFWNMEDMKGWGNMSWAFLFKSHFSELKYSHSVMFCRRTRHCEQILHEVSLFCKKCCNQNCWTNVFRLIYLKVSTHLQLFKKMETSYFKCYVIFSLCLDYYTQDLYIDVFKSSYGITVYGNALWVKTFFFPS